MKYNKDLFIEHLSGMVRIPTVSSADPEKTRVEEFEKLHKYLEEAYPLVHKTLQREIIGKCALLYKWTGTGKSGKLPLLMTAHQDVVPEGDHAMWKYPPFSATLDDEGVLWGRGTTDSKCNIQAYLDAIELLIADGFTPDYDLYLAFGYNEEIMGGPGAAGQIMHDELKKRGVQFGMAIDECGGIAYVGDKPVATIIVCEKGYADYEFYVDDPGGHSAFPPVHNALGMLGKAIWDLECNRMDTKLIAPVIAEMKDRAEFMTGHDAEIYADPEGHWDEIKELAETQKVYNQLTRTTTTPTMANGSAQANILPEHATVVTNSRLLPGETLQDLEAHFAKVMPENVKFRLVKGHNPPPVQTTDSYGYRLIKKIISEKYPGVKFIPSMLAGGTDSRYYCDLTPTNSVYRFTGILSSAKTAGAHQVNEHIDTNILCDNVDFYVQLFKGYGDAE
jgi:carboxypeptidase PM20D1